MNAKVTKELAIALRDRPSYKPERLLAIVREATGSGSDSDLARLLGIHVSMVSRVRSKQGPITSGFIVAVLDVMPTMTLHDLRLLAGLPKDAQWGL